MIRDANFVANGIAGLFMFGLAICLLAPIILIVAALAALAIPGLIYQHYRGGTTSDDQP